MELRVIDGDLLDQDVEAIVNAWNRNVIPWWLLLPQGVSGAIKRRAGYEPFRELARKGPIPLGGAVVTGAGRLPFRAIIHVAGISLFWCTSERAIRGCVRSALAIAREKGYRSVAFPLIGAGTGGFSAERALGIMQDEARRFDFDGEVRIVRFRKVGLSRMRQRASLSSGVLRGICTPRALAALALAASLVLPATALAKRIPAPIVAPVLHEGIRYAVPNDKGTVGYVVASDVATGKQVWKKTIFRKCLCPCLEHDVQWVFIKQMRLDGQRLLLVTERDKVYSLDLKTRKVRKLKAQTQAQQGPNADAAGAGQQQCTGSPWPERQPVTWAT